MSFKTMLYWIQFAICLALAAFMAELRAHWATLTWGFAAGTSFVVALAETFDPAD